MKIFDCFLFFNELELLELRLSTLREVVDYFVLVEADTTFTGNKKDFLFEQNRNRFTDYLDRIVYIKVEDVPPFDPMNSWAIENFQRSCIKRGLLHATSQDRVILSDVDEIPNPDTLKLVLDRNQPVTLRQYLFYYFVNCFGGRGWNGSVVIPFKDMPSAVELRALGRRGRNRVGNGGWHYSYMGGLNRIKLKLNNLSDAYTRFDQLGSDEDISRKIRSQRDLWDESRAHRLIDIKAEGYSPEPLTEFIQKYPSFYFNHA